LSRDDPGKEKKGIDTDFWRKKKGEEGTGGVKKKGEKGSARTQKLRRKIRILVGRKRIPFDEKKEWPLLLEGEGELKEKMVNSGG